jgi:fumarylacetoacetase
VTGFGIDALPYGSFSVAGGERRIGARYGDCVVDLTAMAAGRPYAAALAGPVLNPLMAAGPAVWAQVRADVQAHVRAGAELIPLREVTSHLPIEVADYVDFYSSRQHATNVGRILRPDGEPLAPNWEHLPIGYHGRAGTVVVSGTEVIRPCGQRAPRGGGAPGFGPSRRLDIEAEIGFVVGVASRLGEPVPVADFARHVFGVVLVNDWSARDLQAWEYVPLGPFLGKSFATSVSAWVLPLAALAAARVPPPPRDVPVLPYLAEPPGAAWGLDISLAVACNGQVISRPPFRGMYWTPAQQLAHLTVNGARLRTGDLFASGTVSGPEPDQYGSLLELSWGGRDPVPVGAQTRTFLEDGDEVVITGTAPGTGGERVALGEVRGRIRPALTGD